MKSTDNFMSLRNSQNENALEDNAVLQNKTDYKLTRAKSAPTIHLRLNNYMLAQ